MAADLEAEKQRIGLIAAMEQLTTNAQRWAYQLKLAYEQTLKNEAALKKAAAAAKTVVSNIQRVGEAAKQAAAYTGKIYGGTGSLSQGDAMANAALKSEYYWEYAKKLGLSMDILDADVVSMDSVFKNIKNNTVSLADALSFLQQKAMEARNRLNQEDLTRDGDFMRRYNEAKAEWERLKVEAPGTAQLNYAANAFQVLEDRLRQNQSGIVQKLKTTIESYGQALDYLRSLSDTYDDPELYTGGNLAALLKEAITKLGGVSEMTADELEAVRIANFNFNQATQTGKTYKLDLTVGNQTLTTIADRDPQEFIDALMAALENARRSAA